MLAARSAASLEAAAGECRAAGAEVVTVVADVVDEDDVSRVLDAAVQRFGRVDGWVHTAAVVAYGRFEDVPVGDLPPGAWTPTCTARCTSRGRRCAQFRRQGHGTLVLTGSLLGEIATPYMSSYVTAKWAVRGLARVLAIEARETPDVHVCIVSPGGVDTPVYQQAANYAGRAGRPPPPVDPPEKVPAAVVRAGRPPAARSVGPANLVVPAGFTAAAAGVRPAGRAVDAGRRAVPAAGRAARRQRVRAAARRRTPCTADGDGTGCAAAGAARW